MILFLYDDERPDRPRNPDPRVVVPVPYVEIYRPEDTISKRSIGKAVDLRCIYELKLGLKTVDVRKQFKKTDNVRNRPLLLTLLIRINKSVKHIAIVSRKSKNGTHRTFPASNLMGMSTWVVPTLQPMRNSGRPLSDVSLLLT